jgi:hypothetical protein
MIPSSGTRFSLLQQEAQSMKRKPILDIRIEANGPALHMKGENSEVDMIPFKGTVESELFTGIVEPCGVDTQIVNAVHVRHMSARYLLTGKDSAGAEAHIYVENNGWFDDRTKTMPFHTVPTFYTDSAALAPYLHSSHFEGEGVIEEDGLHIYFYEIGGHSDE